MKPVAALSLLVCIICKTQAWSFAARNARIGSSLSTKSNLGTCSGIRRRNMLLWSSNEDEIATLEEKLRLLKQAKAKEAEELKLSEAKSTSPASLSNELIPEMLSESWKEEDSAESGISLVPLFGSLALLAFFIVFSQIPVGQDDLRQYAGNIKETTSSIDLGDLNPVKVVKDSIYTPPIDELSP